MVFTKKLFTPGLSRGLFLTLAVILSFPAITCLAITGLAITGLAIPGLAISGQPTSSGQAPTAPAQTASGAEELYGGIELAADSVTSVAMSISKKEDDGGLKLLYSDTTRLLTGRERNWKAGSKTIAEAMQEVLKAMERLRTQWKIPFERIYVIGGSELKGDQPDELVRAVLKITGKTLTYLEPEMETQLAIAGVIAQRAKVGESFIDNRNYSLWIGLDSYMTKGGYQHLRYTPTVEYDFVAMNLPLGAVNFTDLVIHTTSESAGWTTLVGQAKFLANGALKDQLRKEIEAKPGLLTRKRIYLTGDVPSAIAALLYPENRQSYVTITMKDIEGFAARAASNPRSLLNPIIPRAVKPELKQEIEKELAAIRKSFSTQQLMAGAEFLRVLSTELNWRDKDIRFARFGRLTSILGYLRLQAGK